MKILGLAVSACAFAALTGGAFAADLDPPVVEAPAVSTKPMGYLALRGGGSWYDDTDFTIAGPTTIANSYDDTQFMGTVAFGGDFGGLRAELELGFFSADIETHTAIAAGVATPFTEADSFGELHARTAMFNAYYDFQMGSFKPFVGAGIGIATVEVENFGVLATGPLLNDRDRGLAWQVTAGLGYEVMEGLDLELGYRYQNVSGVDLIANDGTASEFDFSSHHVFAGIRAAI